MKKIITIAFLLALKTTFGQFGLNSFFSRIDSTSGLGGSNNVGRAAALDIDNDNKLDIIVPNITNNSLSIFRNLSSSNSFLLSTKINFNTLIGGPECIGVGDFDNNGRMDFAVTLGDVNVGTRVIVYRNTTVGSVFSFDTSSFLVGASPKGIFIADFDGDGKVDIATSNFVAGTLSILRNTSTGIGNINFAPKFDIVAGNSPILINGGDFDGDGKIDLASLNYISSGTARIFKNNSTVGNLSFALIHTLNLGSFPSNIDVGNLNNDNKLDFVASNFFSSFFTLFTNATTQTLSFSNGVNVSTTTNGNGQSIKITDIDLDGVADVIVGNSHNSSQAAMQVFKNNGNANLSLPFSYPLSNGNMIGLITPDLNNDGFPDVIISNQTASQISIFINRHFPNKPSVGSTNMNFVRTNDTTVNVSFTKGNGYKRLVIASTQPASFIHPSDSQMYLANSIFGLGQQIGNGNFVVYNDTGSSFNLSNLPPGVIYLAVYEYNGSHNRTNYLTNDICFGQYVFVRTYYAKSTGFLNVTNSWGINPDGSGISPSSFNESFTNYFVTNNNNPTLNNNWFITGINTAIVVSGGYNLVVPQNITFGADSIRVLANGTITLNGNIFANKVIFDTLSNAQFTSNNAQNIPGFNYYNLITSGGLKTLVNNTTVRNALTLLANLNTANHTITVGTSTAQTGSLITFNTYIIGKLNRWMNTSTQGNTFQFPVGAASTSLPVQLTFSGNLSTGGTISCEFILSNPGNGGLPLFDFTASPVVNVNKAAQNGYWRIETGNGLNLGSSTFNISLNGTGFWGVNNFSELRVIRRPVNGSWQLIGSAGTNTGTNASPVAIRNGINLFGDFTIGGDLNNNPLPVGLTRFSGNWMNNHIILNWQTAFEENASGFTIEKLANNQWIEAGFVPAKGNTSRLTNYTFTDENPALKQDNYYRLKLLDIDHAFEYSKVIVVNQNQPDNLLNIWPNPAGQQLHINGLFEPTLVEVYNQNGKLVKTSTTTNQLNISELENGLYFIKTNGQTARFLKVE